MPENFVKRKRSSSVRTSIYGRSWSASIVPLDTTEGYIPPGITSHDVDDVPLSSAAAGRALSTYILNSLNMKDNSKMLIY